MDCLKFERISGEGLDALYDVYVDGKLKESHITINEVSAIISNVWENEGDKNV